MSNVYKQKICKVNDIAKTLNGIMKTVSEGVELDIKIIPFENANKVAVCYREILRSGGISPLPSVTAEDNGNVLTVINGMWNKAAPSGNNFLDGKFVMTFTWDDDENTYICDKTFAECAAEYEINNTNNMVPIVDDGLLRPFVIDHSSSLSGDLTNLYIDILFLDDYETIAVESINFSDESISDDWYTYNLSGERSGNSVRFHKVSGNWICDQSLSDIESMYYSGSPLIGVMVENNASPVNISINYSVVFGQNGSVNTVKFKFWYPQEGSTSIFYSTEFTYTASGVSEQTVAYEFINQISN